MSSQVTRKPYEEPQPWGALASSESAASLSVRKDILNAFIEKD